MMKEIHQKVAICLCTLAIIMLATSILYHKSVLRDNEALAKSVESFPDHSELKKEYLKP